MVETLVVVAILALLAALFVPAVVRARIEARRAACLGHLKNIGTASHLFANEHHHQFPAAVPQSEGGAMEAAREALHKGDRVVTDARLWTPFHPLLHSPKVLHCPADASRRPAPGFGLLGNEHLSYFQGVTAAMHHPESVLAGDRNLFQDRPARSRASHPRSQSWSWQGGPHPEAGQLLFADGHAARVDPRDLPRVMASAFPESLSPPFSRDGLPAGFALRAWDEATRWGMVSGGFIQHWIEWRQAMVHRPWALGSIPWTSPGRASLATFPDTALPSAQEDTSEATDAMLASLGNGPPAIPGTLRSMRMLTKAGMFLMAALLVLFALAAWWLRGGRRAPVDSAATLLRRAGDLWLDEQKPRPETDGASEKARLGGSVA